MNQYIETDREEAQRIEDNKEHLLSMGDPKYFGLNDKQLAREKAAPSPAATDTSAIISEARELVANKLN